jgi:hypothetical protein
MLGDIFRVALTITWVGRVTKQQRPPRKAGSNGHVIDDDALIVGKRCSIAMIAVGQAPGPAQRLVP